MWHTSKIELNEQALINNLNFLRNEFGNDVTISSVVKGNAYGHGIEPFVCMLERNGVNHYSVFSADEAYRVKKALTGDHPIMLMGFLDQPEMEWCIENDVEFFVFEKLRLNNAIQTAHRLEKKALIHIEVETGMNRTGFDETELENTIQIIKENPDTIVVKGLCTHFAGAESISNYIRIEEQKKRFIEAEKYLKSQNIVPEFIHCCCSAAALRYPEMRRDLVRIGILQYGFWPSPEVKIEYIRKNKTFERVIRRVMSWESKVMSIKDVNIGEFIGYGSSYLASRDMKIGIVPVGYAYGFSRSFSNSGRVLVRGKRVPVVGIVNMNSIAIDLTTAPESQLGDEAVLIGYQGELEITASSFSEMSEQLNYEVLTRLPTDIPRAIKN